MLCDAPALSTRLDFPAAHEAWEDWWRDQPKPSLEAALKECDRRTMRLSQVVPRPEWVKRSLADRYEADHEVGEQERKRLRLTIGMGLDVGGFSTATALGSTTGNVS